MTRVALSGGFRSGKTTLGNKLAKEFGYQHLSLADELKRLLVKSRPDLKERVYAEDKDLEIRKILESYSYNIRCKYGNEFFVNKVKNKITSDKVVISDVRFNWEIIALLDWKLVFIGECTGEYDTQLFYNIANLRVPSKPKLRDLIKGDLLC